MRREKSNRRDDHFTLQVEMSAVRKYAQRPVILTMIAARSHFTSYTMTWCNEHCSTMDVAAGYRMRRHREMQTRSNGLQGSIRGNTIDTTDAIRPGDDVALGAWHRRVGGWLRPRGPAGRPDGRGHGTRENHQRRETKFLQTREGIGEGGYRAPRRRHEEGQIPCEVGAVTDRRPR